MPKIKLHAHMILGGGRNWGRGPASAQCWGQVEIGRVVDQLENGEPGTLPKTQGAGREGGGWSQEVLTSSGVRGVGAPVPRNRVSALAASISTP